MINDDRNYQRMQEQLQQNTPYSANNGNPQGANNMGSEMGSLVNRNRASVIPQKNPNVYRGGQEQGIGRYRPPTMTGNGQWQDNDPYSYNLPNAFGSYPGYSQGNPNGMQGGPGLGQMFPQGQGQNAQFMEMLRMMMGPNNAGNSRGRPDMFAGGPGGLPAGPGGTGGPVPQQSGGRNIYDMLRQMMEQQGNNKLPQQDLQANNKLPTPDPWLANNTKIPTQQMDPSGGRGVAPVMNPNFDPTMVSGPSNNNGSVPQVPRRIMGRRGELAAYRGSGGGFGG